MIFAVCVHLQSVLICASLQLFLSLTNLFHAHALPRALTTSAEIALTVVGLYYWPLIGTNTGKRGGDTSSSKLFVSLALAALAFVLRPTNIVLWVVLGIYHLSDQAKIGLGAVVRSVGLALAVGYVHGCH